MGYLAEDPVTQSPLAPTVRILTWNVERKHPVRSPLGVAALDYVFTKEPDVLVLTESSADTSPLGGHVLAGPASDERGYRPDERKVVLWSRAPWRDTGTMSLDGAPADTAVWGITHTPLGPLRVLGLCIPWHMAATRDVEPKRKQWEVHIEFLDALGIALRGMPAFDVIAGDFNQLRPRTWGSKLAEQKLLEVLAGYVIATDGPLTGCERSAGVDHIAVGARFQSVHKFGWPHKVGEQRFSDHEGAGVVLARRQD